MTATLAPLGMEKVLPEGVSGIGGAGPPGPVGRLVAALTPRFARNSTSRPTSPASSWRRSPRDLPPPTTAVAPGDMITEVNGAPKVSSVGDFRTALQKVGKGDYVRLYVRRFVPQEVSRYVIIRTHRVFTSEEHEEVPRCRKRRRWSRA